MDIRDIAKELKVSVATVSRALNPSTAHKVSEPTRRRVLKFVHKKGYVPHRAARALSTGKTFTIGVVLPNVFQSIFYNDHLIKVLAGVYDVLDSHEQYNCKVLILPQGKILSQLESHVVASGLDGLLLSPYCDPALHSANFPKSLLHHWSHPVVVLNLNLGDLNKFSCVYADQFEAARKAVTYLIQKGHQRIAMIRGDGRFPEVTQRYEGYQRALKDHGILPHKSWVVQGNFLIESGYESTLALFRQASPKPTALFCANDEMAIGALRALRSLRIRCPRDVAVMGFDGLQEGDFVTPRLTSMAQPMGQIANVGTHLLINLIEEKIKGPVSRAVPSQLLIRESV